MNLKKDLYGNYITCLTCKQYRQLISISEQAQPYLPFTEVAFLELMKIASAIIFNKGFNNSDLSVRSGLVRFKSKFYFHGMKVNTRRLTDEQYKYLWQFYAPRMAAFMTRYKPIERDVFVMTFRACKRYMITGMTKESEDTLIERLISIANLMR